MLRLLVSGLILAVGVGQTAGSSTQCCDPRLADCQQKVSECMSSSFSSDSMRCQSICDPSKPDCQNMINQCMTSSTAASTARCQGLACSVTGSTIVPSPMPSFDSTFKPSPPPTIGPITDSTFKPSFPSTSEFTAAPTRLPADFTALPSPVIGGGGSGSDSGSGSSSRCCDGTTEMCKMTISMCLATTGNPSMCERMACPSPGASAYPTPSQCCDGSMPGCQMSYRACMNETRSADMCSMVICRDDNGSPVPSKQPITQCCDPSLASCQMAVRECLAAGQPETMCKMIMCQVPPTPPPSRVPDAPSPPPTQAPSRPPMFTQRPTPSAAPTMFIKPLFSSMPSRLPKRTAAPTNFVIPERMPAALTFPKANLTMFKKPEKIQEIQAKLACALRLPLEKIEIRNISILRATGKLEALDIDVSVARLSSNGSAKCAVFKDDPIVPQVTPQRRNLQGTTESIVVDYDIVSPPEEIAVSSANDLNTAISSDPSMLAFASSVGSTGVSANVVAVSAPVSAGGTTGGTGAGGGGSTTASGSSTQSASSTMSPVAIGVGVAVGAAAVVGIGVAASIYKNRKRRQARQVIQPATAVWRHSVVQQNPAHSSVQGSTRIVYMPGQIRV